MYHPQQGMTETPSGMSYPAFIQGLEKYSELIEAMELDPTGQELQSIVSTVVEALLGPAEQEIKKQFSELLQRSGDTISPEDQATIRQFIV